jgi:hypothetical protein
MDSIAFTILTYARRGDDHVAWFSKSILHEIACFAGSDRARRDLTLRQLQPVLRGLPTRDDPVRPESASRDGKQRGQHSPQLWDVRAVLKIILRWDAEVAAAVAEEFGPDRPGRLEALCEELGESLPEWPEGLEDAPEGFGLEEDEDPLVALAAAPAEDVFRRAGRISDEKDQEIERLRGLLNHWKRKARYHEDLAAELREEKQDLEREKKDLAWIGLRFCGWAPRAESFWSSWKFGT